MKIAVVASGHIPSQWAHSINVMKHANAFKKFGHNVEVLSVSGYYEDKLLNQIDSIYEWYGIDSLPIKFFKLPFFTYFKEVPKISTFTRVLNFLTFKKLHHIFDPEKQISNYLKDNNFDLCYARSYKIVKYNIENKIPTILETHNYIPHKTKDLKNILKLSHSIYFKKLVTIHNDLKVKYIKLGVPENKIVVLEDAVDLDIFDKLDDNKAINRKKLNIPLDKKIIMYCGSLKNGKGIHIILDTAKKLENNKKIIFYIVGGSKQEVNKWQNYKKLNYTNVVFTGFVKGSLIPLYLKSSDILFMPYDINERDMVMDINTTSPIKLFEYMASKRPIVTTNIPVITKILSDDDAIIVKDNNYKDAILNILNDRDRQKKISDNSYKLVQQFTYKERCKTILKENNG